MFFEEMEKKNYYFLYRNLKTGKILIKTIKLVEVLFNILEFWKLTYFENHKECVLFYFTTSALI